LSPRKCRDPGEIDIRRAGGPASRHRALCEMTPAASMTRQNSFRLSRHWCWPAINFVQSKMNRGAEICGEIQDQEREPAPHSHGPDCSARENSLQIRWSKEEDRDHCPNNPTRPTTPPGLKEHRLTPYVGSGRAVGPRRLAASSGLLRLGPGRQCRTIIAAPAGVGVVTAFLPAWFPGVFRLFLPRTLFSEPATILQDR